MAYDRNAAHAAWDALQQAGGICTQADLVERWGISRARVSQLIAHPDFPDPVGDVGARMIWLIADVEAFRNTERKPGPRPH